MLTMDAARTVCPLQKSREDESSLKKVLETQTMIKGSLGDCAPATSGICERHLMCHRPVVQS
jgi:hypothetical protein